MAVGAGYFAATRNGARVVDPRPFAVGSIAETFQKYKATGPILPAMGYSSEQIKDLETTINAATCDAVLIATPVDLERLIKIQKPCFKIRYELQEIGKPTLQELLAEKFGGLEQDQGNKAKSS